MIYCTSCWGQEDQNLSPARTHPKIDDNIGDRSTVLAILWSWIATRERLLEVQPWDCCCSYSIILSPFVCTGLEEEKHVCYGWRISYLMFLYNFGGESMPIFRYGGIDVQLGSKVIKESSSVFNLHPKPSRSPVFPQGTQSRYFNGEWH